jgi:indole-3-glycerol phosphate synthase
MMSDILEKIEAYKREEIAPPSASVRLSEIEAAPDRARAARLRQSHSVRKRARGEYALIAEIKKASRRRA